MTLKGIVLIAVHPHNAYGIYDRDRNYVQNRDERLSNLRLEHVILVDQPDPLIEKHKLDIIATAEKVDMNNPYWRGRIFLTHSGDYASDLESGRKLDFTQLSTVIRLRFPADKYVFWGAELHQPPADLESREGIIREIWKRRNNQPYGCVIFYHNILDLSNKVIDQTHCLIFDG